MRIGVVSEGSSDWVVLEAFIRSVLGEDVEFQRLVPEQPAGQPVQGGGWPAVRAWCLEWGSKLEALMRGVEGQDLHLLVIHVDCSMAQNVGARHPCPPAKTTADALRSVINSSWLGRPTQPPYLVLATPAQATEAWLVAALVPPYGRLASVECRVDVENELVARRILSRRPGGGGVRKPVARFEPLAADMVQRLADVRAACSEADRFGLELLSAIPL
jgi:hypothetical protein